MDNWRYGIVIDAGSSGSRAHVYRWLNPEIDRKKEQLPVVETKKKWTKKIHPGISTFGSNPEDVGPEHLDELVRHALDTVPEDQVKDTPIFLLATAGVRLLEPDARRNLLGQVCSYLKKETDFLLPDCDLHIQVIPGETEGLYGWIAANYLLGGFDNPSQHDHGKDHHTYGFLDMGGASSQIAFAPNSTEAANHADDLILLRLRNMNGVIDEYQVFVTTWLEFGVNKARERYIKALIDGEVPIDGELPDPCLPRGLSISTEGDILAPNKIDGKKTHLAGTGKFDECLKKSYPLLNKDVVCTDEPCPINGVHVPSIDFDVNHFVGVSEYWHTTHQVFEMDEEEKPYNLDTFKEKVKKFCSMDWEDIQKKVEKKKWGKKVDEAAAAEVCFKANWVINMLHKGIGIPETPDPAKAKSSKFLDPFHAVDKIHDTEVSWTLGKMVLYASGEVPPRKAHPMPVGFGSNVQGVPDDWQYPSVQHHTYHRNGTEAQPADSWRETLLDGKTPRRIPGFFLFFFIVALAIFLLCGKERRARFFHRTVRRFGGPRFGRKGRGVFAPKISLHSPNRASDRLLEGGMLGADDFELGQLDDDGSYSDGEDSDSLAAFSKTGKSSGWATPRMRTPKLELPGGGLGGSGMSGDDLAGASGGQFGLGINAMERSGLIVRTESRERLPGFVGDERGRKSRRNSPTRHKSPLVSSIDD